MLNSRFFKSSRQSLRSKYEPGSLMVFTASGVLQRNASNTYPFRQDSSFWYLSGVEEPDVLLVMAGEDEFLILPKRSLTYEIFNGKPDVRRLSEVSGVERVHQYDEGMKKLERLVRKHKRVITMAAPARYIESAGFYSNQARKRLGQRLRKILPEVELIDARPAMSQLRSIKRPEEIEAIEKALAVTINTFEDVRKNLDRFKTEADVVRAVNSNFIKLGASGPAYESIAAAGPNACILHARPGDKLLKPGELVLIDAGAELNNYASDLTRTYSLGKPTKRQRELFEAVMGVRETALSLIRPGTHFQDYETKVRKSAAKLIKGLGLGADVEKYYPHSTSHFLGLDVHDAGDYSGELSEGMVLTVEPGIYIPEEGLGMRIEDDILVTKDGYRNLSEKLSRELE